MSTERMGNDDNVDNGDNGQCQWVQWQWWYWVLWQWAICTMDNDDTIL